MSLRQLIGLASRPGALWIDPSSPVGSRGRSTFASCEPALWLRGSGSILELIPGPAGDRGWLARVEAADPGPGPSFERLAAIGRRLRTPLPVPNPDDGREPPRFTGGFAGCFSYDLGRRFEDLPQELPAGLPWDFLVGLYDEVIELSGDDVIHHSLGDHGGRLRAHWEDAAGAPDLGPGRIEGAIVPEMDAEEHQARVLEIQELIRAGTIYQANLTLRFEAACQDPAAPLATFLRLRASNPAPHGSYQQLPGLTLVSSSPECFLDLSTSGHVVSRPIKGTAARAASVTEDSARREQLLGSMKDRSELSMIVDLIRNDIGRVCTPGTVDRRAELVAEAHPTVWHLVGEARGRLATGRDAYDLLRACFPPGSCIGAPKLRAMQVLEKLEKSRRGPYTGSVGWIGLNGAAALSVTIRTLCFDGETVSYGVGGGIVHDSEPRAEWEEALLKGRALAAALGQPEPAESDIPEKSGPSEPLTQSPFGG